MSPICEGWFANEAGEGRQVLAKNRHENIASWMVGCEHFRINRDATLRRVGSH